MKEKIRGIILIIFYLVFLVAVFLFAYYELPNFAHLTKDKEEIRIIKEIYAKLEKEIPEIDEIRGEGKNVIGIGIKTDEKEDSINSLFASNFEIDTIYREKEESDYQFCLNRYTVFNDERIYTEKCHDVNTIEYYNKDNMFKAILVEPTKMTYTYTTQYKENNETVYTDYEVTLTNTDGTWKISDGIIIVSDDYAEYFVYIKK